MTDKYSLSRVHSKIKKVESESEDIYSRVPRVIYELKDSLIVELIRQKLIQLKTLNDTKDYNSIGLIMKEIEQIEGIKRQLSKTLGERIIIKI